MIASTACFAFALIVAQVTASPTDGSTTTSSMDTAVNGTTSVTTVTTATTNPTESTTTTTTTTTADATTTGMTTTSMSSTSAPKCEACNKICEENCIASCSTTQPHLGHRWGMTGWECEIVSTGGHTSVCQCGPLPDTTSVPDKIHNGDTKKDDTPNRTVGYIFIGLGGLAFIALVVVAAIYFLGIGRSAATYDEKRRLTGV